MEKIKKTNYTEPPFEDAFEGIESLVVREGFSKVLYNDIIEFADKNKIPYSRKELLSQCSSGALTLREKELLKAVNQ